MARAYCRIACNVVYLECIPSYKHRRRFYQTDYVCGMVRDGSRDQMVEIFFTLVYRTYRIGLPIEWTCSTVDRLYFGCCSSLFLKKKFHLKFLPCFDFVAYNFGVRTIAMFVVVNLQIIFST
jgi:hypothetical protein